MKYVFWLVLCLLVLGLTHNGFAQPHKPHKYAAGTTVNHQIKHGTLQYIDINGIRVEDVVVERKVDYGTYQEWEMPDPHIEVEEITHSQGTIPGIQVRMRLHKDAWKTGEKKLLITGHRKDDGSEQLFTTKGFTVVPLKTVIIAVDGLGHQSIINVLKSKQGGATFKKIFGKAVNRDTRALSALPSITFTNWPGIFGGRMPKDHGILGNTFFEREKTNRDPFASEGDFDITQNFSVITGELNNRTRQGNAGSLYDRVAEVLGREIDVWSIHGFYALSQRPHVALRAKHYGGDWMEPTDLLKMLPTWMPLGKGYHGHSQEVAKNLDVASGNEAREIVKNHLDILDILTVYFPGPDNLAHAIGDEKARGTFNVDVPLAVIEKQIRMVTDAELGKIVEEIEKQDYLNATLFVLVSDHGLHGYKNDRLHNIYLPEQRKSNPKNERDIVRKERAGLEDFFKAMGLKVWRGLDISGKTLVYSPNGGMAHIYIRNTQEINGELIAPWNKPARKVDIEMVARQLFIEAVGGAGGRYVQCPRSSRNDPNKLTKSMQETGCYAQLTKLHGALGNPPAIFVRVGKDDSNNHFKQNFRWLKRVESGWHPKLEYGEIDEFIQARSYKDKEWPAFAERIEEMNDQNIQGSRTGDIVIFTDGQAGYLTITEGEGLNGWHGGATKSESNVALMFNFPGSAVDEKFKKDLIKPIIEEVKNKRKSRTLRNWDLKEILGKIYMGLHAFEPKPKPKPKPDLSLDEGPEPVKNLIISR